MPKHEPNHKHEIEVKLRAGDRAELLRRLGRLGARPAGGRVHEMNVLYDTPRRDLFGRGEALRVRIERPAPTQAPRRALAKRAGPTETPRERSSRGASGGSGEIVTLTYKGPVGPPGPAGSRPSRAAAGAAARDASRRYKVRTEDELRVPAADPLDAILRASGLLPSFRYEKYRQSFRLPGLPGLVIDLDETPVGVFVELEGSPSAIDRAAARLGYGPADYITKSYPALYTASLQKSPQPRPKTAAKARARARRVGRRQPPDAMLFPKPRPRPPRPRKPMPKRSQ